MLHNAVVLPCRLHHATSLANIVAQRFLDIHILARLTGPDCQQRVPMIGCGNGYCVEVLVVERFAWVLDALWGNTSFGCNHFAPRFEQPAIWINQIGNVYILHACVGIKV